MSIFNSVKFFTVTIIAYFIYNTFNKYKKKEFVYKIYNEKKRFFLKWKKNTEIKVLSNFINYLASQPKKKIVYKIYNQKKRFFLKWKKNTEIEVWFNIVDYLASQPNQEWV